MAIDIIFVLGPSGVGKSELSSALAKKLDYEFYEIDQHPADGIDEHKLRREWDEFWLNSRPEPLVDALRERAHAAEKKGIVLGLVKRLVAYGFTYTEVRDLMNVLRETYAPLKSERHWNQQSGKTPALVVGISQVLPVIVAALYRGERGAGAFVAIEQPECTFTRSFRWHSRTCSSSRVQQGP